MVSLQMGFHHQQRKCWDPESVLFRISWWNPYWCEHGDELSNFHMFPMNFYIYIIPILIWKVNIVQSKMVIIGWFPLYIFWWLNQVRSPFLDCQISMFHNLHPQVWFNFHFWGWNPHLSWWNHHFSWWNPSFFEGKRPANSAKPSSVSDGRSSRPSARSGDHIESTLGFHHNHV
jgi:hypothetical protein